MSASLVGSEMCIRDSSSTPSGTTPSSSSTVAWGAGPRRSPGTASSTSTVSYTHLTLPTICSV
eukprot:2424615-Alexandrium_andersonii.AAC.1